MDSTGEDLLNTFQKLGISGTLDPVVIAAWFDTDCRDTIAFLNWLCQLGKENVASALEIERYEKLAVENALLEGAKYESALDDINNQYRDIFDVENNTVKAECMETEVTMLVEEEKRLENIIFMQENLDKKLTSKMASLRNEEMISNIKKENAEEQCFEYAHKLDGVNTKLHQQIVKCSNKFVEFEFTEMPAYISQMPLDEYNLHYNNILSNINSFMARECNVLPNIEVAKSCKKLDKSIFHSEKVSEDLLAKKHMLFRSMQNKNYKEATEQKLLGEIKYLKEFNMLNIINLYTPDSILRTHLENSIAHETSQIDSLTLTLENLVKHASDYYVKPTMFRFAEHEMNISHAKLQSLSLVDVKFTEIFSYHALLSLMYASNNNDIKQCDPFFRAVHQCTRDLQNCQLRTEAMLNKINDYNVHKGLTLENKYPLVKAIVNILSRNDSDLSAFDLHNKFENEMKNLEMKLFYEDFVEQRKFCEQLETDIKSLKSFLHSGPTLEYVVLPYTLYNTFDDVSKIIASIKAAVSSTLQLMDDANKRLSENKWLKKKRHLWMHFIIEPRKVSAFIDEIKTEVERMRNGQCVA